MPTNSDRNLPLGKGAGPAPFPLEAVKARAQQVGGTHYLDMDIEPWDVVDTWPLEQQIGFYRASALKYIMRLGSKDEDLQEAKKAAHYVQKLIEVLTGEQS